MQYAFTFAWGFILGFAAGAWCGLAVVKEAALEYNAAYYEVDPKTGETYFIWNPDTSDSEMTDE